MNRIHLLGVVAAALLSGCASSQAGNTPQSERVDDFVPDPRPLARTMVYDCSGYRFIARLGPGEMAVWFEDRYVILSQVRSASGVKYQEGDILFWLKGEEGMLVRAEQQYRDCQQLPREAPWADAHRRGVDFRAVGNEPGWHLEIQHGRAMLFVGDYGELRVSTPDPGEIIQERVRVYHAVTEANDLRVEIVDELCLDTMQDDQYPAQVSVMLNGRLYRGCGRALDTATPYR
jgi:membrane-bound inhibitor of C-type lysozyme